MFYRATSFNQPLDVWDASNITTTRNMFGSSGFNQPLPSWDTSKVVNMTDMFFMAADYDQDIGAWNMENVTSVGKIFRGTSLSRANYDSILIGWDAQNLQSGISMDAGSAKYCLGGDARASMISSDSWTI